MDYKNWIDFVSVVPSYLVVVLNYSWVKNLVIIRLLRVIKFFKLSYGLQVQLFMTCSSIVKNVCLKFEISLYRVIHGFTLGSIEKG